MFVHHPFEIHRGPLLFLLDGRPAVDGLGGDDSPLIALFVGEGTRAGLHLGQHQVVAVGPNPHRQGAPQRQVIGGPPPRFHNLLAVLLAHGQSIAQTVDLVDQFGGRLLRLVHRLAQHVVVVRGEIEPGERDVVDLRSLRRRHQGELRPVDLQLLLILDNRAIVGGVAAHHRRAELQPRIFLGHEIQPTRLLAEPGQSIRAISRRHLVEINSPVPPQSHVQRLGFDGLGPGVVGQPHRLPIFELPVHEGFFPAEGGHIAHHINPDSPPPAEHQCFFQPALGIISLFIGDDEEPHVAPLAALAQKSLGQFGHGPEDVLFARGVVGDAADLGDQRLDVGGWFLIHDRELLAVGRHHGLQRVGAPFSQ